MIQPTLMSYTFDTPPVPVLLDSVSVEHNIILLLDTFHRDILIFPENLSLNGGIKTKKETKTLRNSLKSPGRCRRSNVLVDRFPVSRYIVCDQGKKVRLDSCCPSWIFRLRICQLLLCTDRHREMVLDNLKLFLRLSWWSESHPIRYIISIHLDSTGQRLHGTTIARDFAEAGSPHQIHA